MKFVSLFAGVGGFDLAFERAGFTCAGQVEIDKHAQTVLAKHWPDVPKHDDVKTAKDWATQNGLVGTIDIVCGGFPCQDLSTAGNRAGLAGNRSGLFWDALNFATHVGAQWVILENVPGLFSSNNGRDFATVLHALTNSGFSYVEWRVFDSQFYGVPQRRRRVYIVGHIGDPDRVPLFVEREGGRGDIEEGNETGQNIATEIGGGPDIYGKTGFAAYTSGITTLAASQHKRPEDNIVVTNNWQPVDERQIMNCLPAELYHHNTVVNQDVGQGHLLVAADNFTPSGFGQYSNGVGTLRANGGDIGGGSETLLVSSFDDFNNSLGGPIHHTLRSTQCSTGAMVGATVRRLTPVECERLQGFPDDWTGGQTDGHRYKQMGNAVTVNVAQTVAQFIMDSMEEN